MKIWTITALLIILTCCTNRVIEKPVSSQNRIDSIQISDCYSRAMLSKDSSDYYREKASQIVLKNGSSNCKATRLFLEGKTYLYLGQLDSVDAIADKGLRMEFEPDEIGFRGRFYNLKGNSSGYRRKLYASLDYYVKAEKIFRKVHDLNSLAGIYNNIANNYFSLKDYRTASEYALRAYNLVPYVQEDRIKTNILSTYAIALNKTNQSKKALYIEAKADSIADITKDPMAILASTIGYAEIYKSDNQSDSAQIYYHQCIDLSRKTGVKHFELMAQVGLLSIYEEKQNFQQIINKGDSVLLLAKELNNLDVTHTSKRIIGRAYAQMGEYQKGFAMLNQSYDLYSETAGVENQKNINELRLKYETEKKAKKILTQRFQLAKQQKELGKKQTLIVVLVLLLLFCLLVLFFLRRLSKSRQAILQLQMEQRINESLRKGEEMERTRLAFEIHDGIAAAVAGISYKIVADSDKDEVIELLKNLQEDSRNISHNLMPIDFDKIGLVDAIERFAERISTSNTEIVILNYLPGLDLPASKSHLVYRLLQELIGNALKHANCKSVFVKFEQVNKDLVIEVEDDGAGMTEIQIESGLRSIKERVSAIQGDIIVRSEKEVGTTVKIQIEL